MPEQIVSGTLRDTVVIDLIKREQFLAKELLEALVVVLIRMGNDRCVEIEFLLQLSKSPAEKAVHVVAFTGVDQDHLLLWW
jgi:hypothetical protein